MLRWHWGLTLRRCIELHWSDTHLQQTGLGWWDKIWSKSLFNNDDQIVSIHTELTETIAVWLDPLGGGFIHPGLQSPLFSVDMNFLAHFFHVKQWNAILCYISFSLSFFLLLPFILFSLPPSYGLFLFLSSSQSLYFFFSSSHSPVRLQSPSIVISSWAHSIPSSCPSLVFFTNSLSPPSTPLSSYSHTTPTRYWIHIEIRCVELNSKWTKMHPYKPPENVQSSQR